MQLLSEQLTVARVRLTQLDWLNFLESSIQEGNLGLGLFSGIPYTTLNSI